jgi:tetratricopeptide (TPR) repeat protein
LEGNRQGAFGLAHAAVAAEPGLIQALFLLGQMYAADGDHFQAVQSYRKVLELNPFAAPARIELSRALLAQGASDSSREYADIAIKTAPRDHATRVALTRALLERGDLQKADTEIAQLLQQYPESPAVMSLMGSLSFAQKDFRTARQWLSRSFQRDPASLDTLTGLVALDLASRDPAGARQRVEAALRADENNVRLLLLAARTYRATGMPFASEKALSRAVDLDPSNFDAFSMLGQLYYDHGELSRGRTVFEAILRERPRAVAAHTMLAVILERQGLKDEAIGHYRAALDIDSEAAVAANNLAWLYVESARNVDEAIILARTAKKRLPEQAQVSDTLGWAYYRTERATVLQLALGYLQEAVDQDPGNPVYRYHLGAVLARSGKTADARAQLEEALKLNADFQGAAETRRILAGLQ